MHLNRLVRYQEKHKYVSTAINISLIDPDEKQDILSRGTEGSRLCVIEACANHEINSNLSGFQVVHPF